MAGARFLGTDMTDPEVVPYFTWDDPLTVREIQQLLRSAPDAERFRLLGKILREARDTDVWVFTSPEFVSRNWEKLNPHLGRRRAFWEWLLQQWREDRKVRDALARWPPPIGRRYAFPSADSGDAFWPAFTRPRPLRCRA